MRRREFIGLVGCAAAAWPVGLRAQNAIVPLIGYLNGGAQTSNAGTVVAFRKGLAESGFIENKNVGVEWRWAEGRYETLPALASELVRRNPDVIVAVSAPAALAAKGATSTIPIVFTAGADPVRMGLVESLNRPGGNLTGVNTSGGEVAAKGLGVLRDLLPTAKVIAVLLNSTNRIAEFTKGDIQSAATKIGQQVHILTANDDGGLNDAFRTASNQRFGALLIGNDVFFNSRADYMAKLAAQYAVPSLYSRREFAAAGGLISYGPSLAAANHQVGVYTGLVLKGEKPANLPVILPTKFELVLNSKAAKTLGIALPPTLLAIADEVIE